MEYEIGRFTRRCAASGHELQPGEVFYSVLCEEGGEIRRADYSARSWQGPPEGAIGWWKSRLPEADDAGPAPTPQEALEQCFDHLEDDPRQQDVRYVLALLLVRRRMWRIDEVEQDEQGRETLLAYSLQSQTQRRVAVVDPPEERVQQIQEELNRLLFSDVRTASEPTA